jgi:hypothetical protein
MTVKAYYVNVVFEISTEVNVEVRHCFVGCGAI